MNYCDIDLGTFLLVLLIIPLSFFVGEVFIRLVSRLFYLG